MWEVLLSLCMAGDPGVCRVDRLPGGRTYADCRAVADAAPVPDGWQAQDWPCAPAGETPAFSVTEVAPGVWVHKGRHAEADRRNGGDIANLGFVIGEQAVAVVDAGSTPRIARDLLAAIRARTALPVRWLILTHMHPDHALGAGVFQDAGATVIGHGRLADALGARADSYMAAMARLIGPDFEGARIVTPDEAVEGTREIDLGGRALLLQAHPVAHTDNDLTVLDGATGTWFLGDLLFVGHLPALDGSLIGWTGLTRALAAQAAARVVPGHGPVAAPWPASAAPMLDYLETLTDETRAAVAAGEPMLRAVERIGQGRREGWALFDAFNQRNATAAFTELEWE